MNRGRPIFLQNNQTFNYYELQRLKQMLEYSINNRMKTLEIFNNLCNQPPDEFSNSLLQRLRASDERILSQLTQLYIDTYGTEPNIIILPEDVYAPTYLDSVVLALKLKIDALALQRTFVSLLNDGDLGKLLYEEAVITDLEQQNLISTLYNHYLASYGTKV